MAFRTEIRRGISWTEAQKMEIDPRTVSPQLIGAGERRLEDVHTSKGIPFTAQIGQELPPGLHISEAAASERKGGVWGRRFRMQGRVEVRQAGGRIGETHGIHLPPHSPQRYFVPLHDVVRPSFFPLPQPTRSDTLSQSSFPLRASGRRSPRVARRHYERMIIYKVLDCGAGGWVRTLNAGSHPDLLLGLRCSAFVHTGSGILRSRTQWGAGCCGYFPYIAFLPVLKRRIPLFDARDPDRRLLLFPLQGDMVLAALNSASRSVGGAFPRAQRLKDATCSCILGASVPILRGARWQRDMSTLPP
ncbi:hypothetical protein DFH07DRAFT_946843 [Mycena maculata]|uniref:Uncharacterized protein n=1 Tax=Mycena maculata TaxID=230809 RepID=A0AAD7H776_9AGAR|nr:hypothetical protein DFH07DRAFT_947866 [Mycena maculata]KAJ7713630.1 hypothetical protein DFH07DRAFT_947844 [Mycena maculata]KAJ7721657.1 hypothetical protein DFH07DRAFT_946843 [Mycena maculata]